MMFFNEPKASVIGESSLLGVGGKRKETVKKVSGLPCDHFTYFSIPETGPLVAKWLKAL